MAVTNPLSTTCLANLCPLEEQRYGMSALTLATIRLLLRHLLDRQGTSSRLNQTP
jgi:hypothetical protein